MEYPCEEGEGRNIFLILPHHPIFCLAITIGGTLKTRSEGLRIAAYVVPIDMSLWSLLNKALKVEIVAEPDVRLGRSSVKLESLWNWPVVSHASLVWVFAICMQSVYLTCVCWG